MNTPTEEAIAVSEPVKAVAVISETWTAYRDSTVELAALIGELPYPNDDKLTIAVSALRDLTIIEKTVTKAEEAIRAPLNAKLKEFRALRDDFLVAIVSHKFRITGLINNYQAKERDAKLLREREAKALLDKAEKDRQQAERDAAAAKTEEDKLAAQLRLETAALTANKAEAQLAVPDNTPKGLTTRTRYDFLITDHFACINGMRDFWRWHSADETLKFDRAGFLKAINAESPSAIVSDMIPSESENSITLPGRGIRIFRDTRTNIR